VCKPVINRCYEPVVPTYCEPVYKPVCRPVVATPICRKPVVRKSVARCYEAPKAACACKKSSLLNEDGSFFVYISNKTPHLQLLIDKAFALGLTISGDGTNRVTGCDVSAADVGNYISFGSSTRFDMNWIRRGSYVSKRGYRPVYDMVWDWGIIIKALEEFAAAKKDDVRYTTGGDKVVAHAGFAVVNGVVKRNNRDDVNVRMPISTLTHMTHRHNILDLSIFGF